MGLANVRVWFRLVRGLQWSKNAVVFAALVFGAPSIDHPLLRAIGAFIAFCAMSSATYIVNDWLDLERDRIHPTKRTRPMAAGNVSPRVGLTLAALLAVGSFALSLMVTPMLTGVLLIYGGLMLGYSVQLKHIVLLDAFVIAVGFILRALAGAVAVDVPMSAWLMLCTLLLALFLAFGKRRSELVRLQGSASAHRVSLRGYTLPLLDAFLVITATCSIMSYSIYSFTSESVPANGSMMLSVPFVMFAMLRYLLLVMSKGEGGAPEVLLWRDIPLLTSVIGWSATVIAVMIIAG